MAMLTTAQRYHQSTEHRSSITRITKSERSRLRENRVYKEENEQRSNYSKSVSTESRSSSTQGDIVEKKSFIPIPSERNSTEQREEKPKKIKHKLVRKVKKRRSGTEDENKAIDTEENNHDQDFSSVNYTENRNRESEPKTRVSISSKSQVGKSTTIRIEQPEPIHIKLDPNQNGKLEQGKQAEQEREEIEDHIDQPIKTFANEALKPSKEDREDEKRKVPVTLTIKPSRAKESENNNRDQINDTPREDSHEAEEEQNRTSIRIVSTTTTTTTSDKESGERKLKIDARSTKRLSDLSDSETKHNQKHDKHSTNAADDIYNEKTRKLIHRKQQQNHHNHVKGELNKTSRNRASNSRYHTLPRNFKTVRLPIQLQKEAVNTDSHLQAKQARRLSFDSNVRFDNLSETSRSITSTKSHDLNARKYKKTKHSCRLDGISFEDEDREKLNEKSKRDRRRSNPNLILGRTDIHGLRRARPKSEVIGVQRSASLPRSSQRPRVTSEHYNEFVTIHDFDEFNLRKSRTLPYRKKRVSYQQNNRNQVTEVINENSVSQFEQGVEFEKHLEEHNRFQKKLNHQEQTKQKIQERQQTETIISDVDELNNNLFLSKQHSLTERHVQVDDTENTKEVKEKELLAKEEVDYRQQPKESSKNQSQPADIEKEVSTADANKLEFDRFIRKQRELLLQQLSNRETNSLELDSKRSKDSKERGQSIKTQKQESEVSIKERGKNKEDFLEIPRSSNKGRRHKSVNDADDIRKVLRRHHKSEETSGYSEKESKFLLQNNKEAKKIEKINTSTEDKDTIRVFARGQVIRLSMERESREKFEQRQREYDERQKQEQQQQQQQKIIEDDRYRYMNNEFDRRNITKMYYQTEQQYDAHMVTGERLSNSKQTHSTSDRMTSSSTNGDISNEHRRIDSTKITNIKEQQLQGGLDDVFYSICTHYFYPEDHELIVNLHRYGHIKVPKGLDHEDTCIFYNHLYVYEKEDVFAETLAPIAPKIKTEVVHVEEEEPVFADQEDETRSVGSSLSYGYDYNDDTSSQYSTASRKDRNLYASFKAQQYYNAKHNPDSNNNNGMSIDEAFGSTYETLRNKRKSTNTDDEDNSYRAISPASSSGRSDSFTYSKPRLLRRSDRFPGVGHEIENDYPRWRPKSPAQPDRNYGLSVALPP